MLYVCACLPHQTICGAGELPVEVQRRGEAMGGPPFARAVRATLGGAVRQLRQRLPPQQPIRHFAARHPHNNNRHHHHHHPATHCTLANHGSGTPAAADHSCRTGEQEHTKGRQQRRRHVQPAGPRKSQRHCCMRAASPVRVQTGYTKTVHFLRYEQ